MPGLIPAWDALWAIPHIHAWLLAGWLLYLLWLGGWIVLQKREPVATLSWLISLAALPYVGFAVYYFLGPQRIVRHRRRRLRHHARLPADCADGDDSAELRTLAHATTGLAPSTAQAVQLLVDGGSKYPALLEAIARARDHVHLEYYIYQPDRTGTVPISARRMLTTSCRPCLRKWKGEAPGWTTALRILTKIGAPV